MASQVDAALFVALGDRQVDVGVERELNAVVVDEDSV
jgi:hypothetical protein